MSKGNITGLAHIGIFVKDIQVSIDYYKRLGFTVDKEEALDIRLAFISAGNCLIELVEQKDFPPRADGPVDHVAMVVDCIDTAVDNAINNGIAINKADIGEVPLLGGIKNVFFTGPDGERLEFFEYVNGAPW